MSQLLVDRSRERKTDNFDAYVIIIHMESMKVKNIKI